MTDTPKLRFRCGSCGKVWNDERDVPTWPGPSGARWNYCDECFEPDGNPMENLCDEPGCNHIAACGTPTAAGYRRTCFEHRPAPEGFAE